MSTKKSRELEKAWLKQVKDLPISDFTKKELYSRFKDILDNAYRIGYRHGKRR